MRVAFVISEHAGGLSAGRLARYAEVERRLADVAAADVETVQYEELAHVESNATILSGSSDPWSAHDPHALERLHSTLRSRPGPVLGICAGMQILARASGADVRRAARGTGPGYTAVEILDDSDLLAGLDGSISVWQHHTDEVVALPDGFRLLARSPACAVEALAAVDRPWWGTQFHPESWADDHPSGRVVVENFLRLAGIPLR